MFFYFAAFKGHIGIYPPVADAEVVALVDAYRGPKGNLKIPFGQALPDAVIQRLARALWQQYCGGDAG